MTSFFRRFGAALISLLIFLPFNLALAQEGSTLYAGARGGFSYFDEACGNDSSRCDDNDFAYGVSLGYQINSQFAAEVGYTDYGEVIASYPKSPGRPYTGWLRGWDIAARGSWAVAPQLALYGRLGAAYTDAKVRALGISSKSSGWNLLLGGGIGYDFLSNWNVQLDYQYLNDFGGREVGRASNHLISVGVYYRWGF